MHKVECAERKEWEMTGDDREVIDAVLVELRSRLVPDFEDLAVRIVRAVDAVRQEQRERVLPSIY